MYPIPRVSKSGRIRAGYARTVFETFRGFLVPGLIQKKPPNNTLPGRRGPPRWKGVMASAQDVRGQYHYPVQGHILGEGFPGAVFCRDAL